jgi:SAM-dependent methyltransferase
MTERGLAPGIDTTTPNVARIYDYLLGGKDNFAADREAAEQLIAAIPDVAAIARDNRSFLGRAVRYLAREAGIRQFLDLGSGLPTQANVHELAQGVAPDVRVVYVDNDPVVASHGQALLASRDRVAMALADLRDPASVWRHPEVAGLLDWTQPIALLCTSMLHFVADEDEPHKIIAEYRDHVAPGSYLAITTGTMEEDPAGERDKAAGVYRQASSQLHVRPLAEVRRFFDGFELVEPGLVWITEWRPEPGTTPTGRAQSMRGGVGRKLR